LKNPLIEEGSKNKTMSSGGKNVKRGIEGKRANVKEKGK
jgi:hypothetical protein